MPGQLDRKQQQRLFGGLAVGVLALGGVSLAPALRPPRPTIDSGSQHVVASIGRAGQEHRAALRILHRPEGQPGMVTTCRGRRHSTRAGQMVEHECQTSVVSWVPLAPVPGAHGCTLVRRLGPVSAIYAEGADGGCTAALAAQPPVPPVAVTTDFGPGQPEVSEALAPQPARPAGDYGLLVTWTRARMMRKSTFGFWAPAVPG